MRYYLAFAILLLLLPILAEAVQEPESEYIGPLIQAQSFGSAIQNLHEHSTSSYFLTTYDKKLYHSTNTKTWILRNGSLPQFQYDLATDASSNVYISGKGIHKSADGGVMFSPIGTNIDQITTATDVKIKYLFGNLLMWHQSAGVYRYNPGTDLWEQVVSASQAKPTDILDINGESYMVANSPTATEARFYKRYTTLQGTLPSGTDTVAFAGDVATYYDNSVYIAVRKSGGGGAVYKSSDLGVSWTKVHDTGDLIISISSNSLNGIQIVTSDGDIWRSWSGSVWKQVPNTASQGFAIISTSSPKSTLIGLDSAVYIYDRNAYPVVTLQGSYSVAKSQDLQLTASAQDIDGDTPLAYKWEKVSGSDSYTLTGENAQTAAFRSSQDGVYTINLTVTDSASGKSWKSTTITVGSGIPPPAAPNIDLGPDKICSTGDYCYLFVTGTGLQNVTYEWEQVSGPQITLSLNQAAPGIASFIPKEKGMYNISVTATNNAGGTATDYIAVVVNNYAPSISVNGSVVCIVNTECRINSTIIDADNNTLNIQWSYDVLNFQTGQPSTDITFVSGKNSESVTVLSALAKQYKLTLTVSDGIVTQKKYVDVVMLTKEKFDQLQKNNTAPKAEAGEDKSGRVGQRVPLDGNKSTDPEGYNLQFFWEKISGPDITIINSTEPFAYFTPQQAGEYVLRLTVTDLLGLKANDTVKIAVLADGQVPPSPEQTAVSTQNQIAENKPPVIQLKESVDGIAGELVTLSSLAVDPEGMNLTYKWSQIGGESVNLADTISNSLSFTPEKSGIYTFELTVSDADGKISTKRVTVSVRVMVENKTAGSVDNSGVFVLISGIVILLAVVGLVAWKFVLS